MHIGNANRLARGQNVALKLAICTFVLFVTMAFVFDCKESSNSVSSTQNLKNGGIYASDLTGTLTVSADKLWYKNNSQVVLSGLLQVDGTDEGYTIAIEIYFESETTPRMTFYPITTATGSYTQTFAHPKGNEGTFTVWANVVGHVNPKSSTTYKYDEHVPVVGTRTALAAYIETNPVLVWTASSDNNVTVGDITYTIFRAVKNVGQPAIALDYIAINTSVKTLTWAQTGALTSNKDYWYIVSARDLAGNAANYTSTYTTYDTSKPVISSIASPTVGGVYANSLNISARITDSISFTTWAHVSNSSFNSSAITLTYKFSDLYGTVWSIPITLAGLYNVTVFANDALNHLRISTTVQFTITKQAPIFLNIQDNKPDYLTQGNVTARIQEVTGNTVSKAYLYYSIDNFGSHQVIVPMTLKNGTSTDGYYTALIPRYYYYLYGSTGPRTRIYYKIWANNTGLFNTNISSVYYYDVEDRTKPSFTPLIRAPTTVQFYRTVAVTVNVTETVNASGVDLSIAYLEYRINGSLWINLTMANRGGNKYNALFQSFYDEQKIPACSFNSNVSYRVWARDQRGNWASSSIYSYIVTDSEAPTIVNQGLLTSPVNYNVTSRIYVNFTDVYVNASTLSSGINELSVYINYSINNWGSFNYVTMTKAYGSLYTSSWRYDLPVNPRYGTIVRYKFTIRDRNNNQLISSEYSYTVVDQYAPTYSGLTVAPVTVTYRNIVNISIVLSDWSTQASGINYARIQYVNASGTQGWFTMTNVTTTFWYTFPNKQNYGQTISFTIEIYDKATNKRTVTGTPFTILDLTAPTGSVVLNDADSLIQYYERINVTVTSQDTTAGDALPSGIKNATFAYSVNGGTVTRVLMTQKSGTQYTGTWNYYLGYYNWNDNITYTIYVYDNALNVYASSLYSITIRDNLKPSFYTPTVIGLPIEYDELSNITIRTAEPTFPAIASGVGQVILSYQLNSSVWTNVTCSRYSGTIYDGFWFGIFTYQGYGTTVNYRFYIRDRASTAIWNTTIIYSYSIDDLKSPTIVSVNHGSTPMYNQTATVQVNATEPLVPARSSGIQAVMLNYSVDGVSSSQVPMTLLTGSRYNGIWTANIPAQDYNKTIRYNVTLTDTKGNKRVSSHYSYIVGDIFKPTIGVPSAIDTNNLDGAIEYFENFEISVLVTEVSAPTRSSGTFTVTINYTVNGLMWNQRSMTLKSGGSYSGTWSYTFSESEIAWNQVFNYSIRAVDVAGNIRISSFYSFRVDDKQKPTILNLKLENPPGRYDVRANITVRLTEPTDAAGIQNTTIQYSLNNGISWLDLTASRANGTIYSGVWSVVLPYVNWGNTIQVRCLTYDRQGNSRLSSNMPSPPFVDDFVSPIVNLVTYDLDCEYYEDNAITINVTEAILPALASGVANVYVNYSINNGVNTRLTLTLQSGTAYNGLWRCTIPKQNYGNVIRFNYTVQDVEVNQVKAPISYTYIVQDHVLPLYSNLVLDDNNNHDGLVQYYEQAVVRINIDEVQVPTSSSGIVSVIVNRSNDGVSWTVSPMIVQSGATPYSRVYNFTFAGRDWNTTVRYKINILDVAGNQQVTPVNTFLVRDNVVPTLATPVIENAPVAYYESASIIVSLTEPSTPTKAAGIGSSYINYSAGAGWAYRALTLKNGTIYFGYWTFPLPKYTYGTVVQYRIYSFDQANNQKLSTTLNFTVTDDLAPTVNSTVTNGTYLYYLPVVINATVSEPVNSSGVSMVVLHYSINGVLQTPITMTRVSGNQFVGVYSTTLLPSDYGKLVVYNFTATDVAGNSVSNAQTRSYSPGDNRKPAITNVYLGDSVVEYSENAEVLADLSEETNPAHSSGIQTVILQYSTNNWGSYSNVTMSRKIGIDNYAGTWNVLLPKLVWNTNVKYIVHVYDGAGNKNASTERQFVIADLQQVIMGVPSIEGEPITYNKKINVTINLQEAVNASGVQQAILNYSYYGTTWYTTPMARINGNFFNGDWRVNLSLYLSYGTTFKYTIIAHDNAANTRISIQYSLIVNDTTVPAINSVVQTDNGNGLAPVEYWERAIIRINITEAIAPNRSSGIASVQLYYDINGTGDWKAPAAVFRESFSVLNYREIWYSEIYRSNYLAVIRYYIIVTDNAENTMTSGYYTYMVQDLIAPVFGTISHSSTNYNESVTFTAVINEVTTPANSSGVNYARLETSTNGGSSWVIRVMTRVSGNKYAGTYTVSVAPLNYGTVVLYRIRAFDFAGNNGTSIQSSYIVTDSFKPTFSTFTTAYANPNYNQTQVIDVRIIEATNASGVDPAQVTLYWQNTTSTYSTSMIVLSGSAPYLDNTWRATLAPMSRYGQTIFYWVTVYDVAGNVITSTTRNYNVTDSYRVTIVGTPLVTSLNAPTATVEYDENAIIRVNATEPVLASGISVLRLRWKNSTTAFQPNVTMTLVSGNQYQGIIPLQRYGTIISWHIILIDVAGNVLNYSSGSPITIGDLKAPVFVAYSTIPTIVAASQPTIIKATFNEPAFSAGLNTTLGSAKIHYNITGGTNESNVMNMVWNSTSLTFDYQIRDTSTEETVSFYLEVFDIAGNKRTSTTYSYIANDVDAPVISTVSFVSSVQFYAQLNITINATDIGTGVNQVSVYYRTTTVGSPTVLSAALISGTANNGTWRVTLPRIAYGSSLNFYARAVDGVGYSTTKYDTGGLNYTCTIADNLIPSITDIKINSVALASADVQYFQSANVTVRLYKSLYSSLSSTINSVTLNWTKTGTWNTVPMLLVSGDGHDGVWSAVIPSPTLYNTKVNFTIHAVDQASNRLNTATNTFTVKDHQNPVASNLVVFGSRYYERINITIRLQKNSTNAAAVVSATLSYRINSVLNTKSMNLISGSGIDGVWNASIGPYNYASTVEISINCLDQAGNALSAVATNPLFSIGDNIVPAINVPSINPTTVYYYDDVNVTVRITELQTPTQSSGINSPSVILRYTTNNWASYTTLVMTVIGVFNKFNSTFTAAIPEQNYGTTVAYSIHVRDEANNFAQRNGTSYFVGDNVAPTIVNSARTKFDVYYTETITIRGNLTEATTPRLAAGIKNATLNYIVSGDATIYKVPMVRISGTDWACTYEGVIPAQAYGKTVTNWVTCYDNAGNLGLPGFNKSFVIDDNVAPTYDPTIRITDYNNKDGFIEYNESTNILIHIYEPTVASGVKLAILNWSVSGVVWYTVQRDLPLNQTRFDGWWNWTLTPRSYGTNIRFRIIIRDYEDNQVITSLMNYVVVDLRAPVIGIPTASTPVYYSANGTITVSVSERSNAIVSYDASGVAQVMVNYSANYGTMYTRIATRTSGDAWNGLYAATLPAFNWNSTLRYNVTAYDTAGRRSWTVTYQFVINDTTAPVLSTPFVVGRPIEYYENATITVRITEVPSIYGTSAAGVREVRLYYSIDNLLQPYVVMSLTGTIYSGNWSATLPQMDYGKILTAYVWAEDRDRAGTPAITSNFTIFSSDDKMPLLDSIAKNATVVNYLDDVLITCRARDGVGDLKLSSGIDALTGVEIHWRIGTNPYTTAFMTRMNGTAWSGYYSFKIPKQPYGRAIDYYIYVEDIANNNLTSSTFSYAVDDTVAPVLGVASDNSPQYTTVPSFSITVSEPSDASGVSHVTLNFRVNNGAIQTRDIPTPTSGNEFLGTWQATTGMFNYNENITYNFTVSDLRSNTVTSTTQSFIVHDFVQPVTSIPTFIPLTITYDVHPVIQLRIEDQYSSQLTYPAAINPGQVTINYTATGWGTHQVRSMSLVAGGNYYDGTWTITLPEYFMWNSLVSFEIVAFDNAGNNKSTTGSFSIFDYTAPQIPSVQAIDPNIDGTYEYNETITIRATIAEAPTLNTSSGIDFSSVFLYYRLGTSGPFSSKLMSRLTGAQYLSTWSATINPRPYGTVVQYFVAAADIAGNPYNSTQYSYTVGDVHAPTYSNVLLSGAAPGTQPVYYYTVPVFSLIAIEDTDASGVALVQLNRTVNGTVNSVVSLSPVSGDAYSGTWQYTGVPRSYGSSVSYFYSITDYAGRRRTTPLYSYVVLDNLKPVLSTAAISGAPVEYYEQPTISVQAMEDLLPAHSSSLKEAKITYYYNGSAPVTGSMGLGAGTNYNRTYNFQIPYMLSYSWTLNFTINVTDYAGNWQTTSGSYIVKDLTQSIITSLKLLDNTNEDGNYEYKEPLSVRLDAYEAVNASGINLVLLNYSLNSGLPTSLAMSRASGSKFNGTWTRSIGMLPYGTVFKYNVTVVDYAGNRLVSATTTITIKDSDKPQFSLPMANNASAITYLDTIHFQVNVTKPVNSASIQAVNVTYSINGGASIVVVATRYRVYTAGYSEAWQYILLRQDAFTNITFFFTAKDVAGNMNSSIIRPRQVVDTTKPLLTNILLNGQSNNLTWFVSYSSTLNVTVNLRETDGISNGAGMDIVYLYYRSLGTEVNFTKVPMTRISGTIYNGTWYYLVPSIQWGGTVYLKIEARDRTFLESNYLLVNYNIDQVDSTPPVISAVTVLTFDNYPGYYDISELASFYTASIYADLTTFVNSSGLNPAKIFVQFRPTNETIWRNATLSHVVGNQYVGTVYGMKWYQNITYRVYAENRDGFIALSAQNSYYARDRKAPTRVTDTIGAIVQETEVYVSIRLYEPINASGVNDPTVHVYFRHVGIPLQSKVLSNDGTSKYEGYIDPYAAGTLVEYYFYFEDLRGNIARFPETSNYTYTIGDSKLPIYQETKTASNAPSMVQYSTAFDFSLYCYDEDSSIASITLSYQVGSGVEIFLNSFVKVPGAGGDKLEDKYLFTIPGQNWADTTIRIYPVNITDSSGNKLDLLASAARFYITIVDPVKPSLMNDTINVIDAYQTISIDHGITISFSAIEPTGASGLKNVSMVYTNSTGQVRVITSMYPAGNTFAFVIYGQHYFTNVTYWFVISDRANNLLNTQSSNRTFKVDYYEMRNNNQTFTSDLVDPLLAEPVSFLTFNFTVNVSIRVTEYDYNPRTYGPRYSDFAILGDVYKVMFNRSSAYLVSGAFVLNYSQSYVESRAIDENTLVLARYTPFGYEEISFFSLYQNNNTLVIDNVYQLQTMWLQANQYTEYLVILGKYLVPMPSLVSPVLSAGMMLYGQVTFSVQTQTYAQNVSAYYKVGLGGSPVLIGTNTSSGTAFTFYWNTTTLGNLDEIIFRFVAKNAQGFSGIYENISYFVRVHNIPDSEVSLLVLPSGSIYSGIVLLTATSLIPASSAIFYYTIIGNSTVYVLGTNTTKPVWSGIYPFVGPWTFTFSWNSTAAGDLNDVLFGFNLTSYSIPTQVGTTIASITKTIRNVPVPVVIANIVDGEYVYGIKYITATTIYRGVSALFYIKYATTTLIIGSNSTSLDGGYTFTFTWDTSPIREIKDLIRLYANITNPAGLVGSGVYPDVVFYIRNVPVIIYGLGDLNGQQLTGVITLSVIVAREPLPTQAIFQGLVDPFNTKIPVVIGTATAADRADYFDVPTGKWYYIFTYSWDTRYSRDVQIRLNVTVFNIIGYNLTDSITAFVQLRNIPSPTITSIGPYTSAGVFLKTLNETVVINVTSPIIYAAWVEFYMVFQNGTHVLLSGVLQSPEGDNNTFLFYWNTWLHQDQALIQIECRMYNLGGWSNLDGNPPTQAITLTFNIRNLPQPAGVSPNFWPSSGANWFGNKTVTATTVLNASLAVFYYHNASGDFEMNGAGMGRVSVPAGSKSFTITWHTDLIPEMTSIYIYVVMTSMGGFTNKSVNSPLFNLQNVPQVYFSFIDQSGNVIYGSSVQIRVSSPNLGVNATLYCIRNGTATYTKIGFQPVILTGTEYEAIFIWDSLAFSRDILIAMPGTYDFNVTFRVDMTNAAGRNGTMTAGEYSVFNAPAVSTDLGSLPRIANAIVINVTNTRFSYIGISTANVWFYNGTQLVNLTMLTGLNGRYFVAYNFSSYLINTTMAFTFRLVTMTNIVFLRTFSPYTVNNTPVAYFIEDFAVPTAPTVISGTTTFTANSSVQFSRAEFFVLVGVTSYPLGNFSGVTRVGTTNEWRISIPFDSIDFMQVNIHTADVSDVRIRVRLSNYFGAQSDDITAVYSINNAPGVEITSPTSLSPITGNMAVVARNTRTYITDSHAVLITWNGLGYDTTNMTYNGLLSQWEVSWDSRYVSDNSSFIIRVVMTSDTGLNATGTTTVVLANGLDFMTFVRAGHVYVFNLMGKPRLAMMGSIIVQEDAYLRITVATMPGTTITAGYYVFDTTHVFNITVLNRLGMTNITKSMNITFQYNFTAFALYPDYHGISLNESAITLIRFDGAVWRPFIGTVDRSGKTITIRGLTEFSIFVITARQVEEEKALNIGMVLILLALIGVVIGVSLVFTRPKKEKEQIVAGKKKTCKQCGKYVKPYASTCPYCGYKLAEEETMADAMNKLSHLFIFHEESGVCLYYHPFTDAKIDPQLISGFLSAITSFGGQFDDATKKKGTAAGGAVAVKKSSDLKELVYKEYRILMETSGPCKFAVLITGQTSKILSFKISQFIKHFMRTYEEALKDWKGNVRIFKDVEKMVRLIFGLTKVQPEGVKPTLPGKPSAEEGSAPPTTGPKAPPPGYGSGVPPQKPMKPGTPAPMKPSLPASVPVQSQAAPSATPPAPSGQPPTSGASSLFALKEQIGVPGEFTPTAPKDPEKPTNPLQPKLPPEFDKKDKKKGKK